MSKLLARLVPDLSIAIYRFPVPVFVCVSVFLFNFIETEDFLFIPKAVQFNVYFGGGAAFLASGGMHLLGQGSKFPRQRNLIFAVLAGLAAFALGYFNQLLFVSMLFLIPALILWMMVAGYVRAGVPYGSIWLFNTKLLSAVVLAIIVGGIFFGGIAAIFESLRYLFGYSVDSDIYSHLASLTILIVGPLYGMSLLPLDLDEKLVLSQSSDFLRRGITILINYILVPVLLFYVIILHVYAAKIGFSFELPKGKIGMLVLLFGFGGTAIWLTAIPWSETGSRVLKFFFQFWHWFTIVPTVLLLIAVWQRTVEYGMTPERYGLFLIALWLAMMVGYFAIRKNTAQPQIILGSVMFMLFIASFGPWGAQGVSVSSQLTRLEALLIEKGFLKHGQIVVDVPENNSDATERSIRSSIRFFKKQNRLDVLRPYFENQKDDPFTDDTNDWKLVRNIESRLAINQQARANEIGINYHHTRNQKTVISAPSELFGPLHFSRKGIRTIEGGIKAVLDKEGLTVTLNGQVFKVGQRQLLTAAKIKNKDKSISLKVRLEGEQDVWLLVTTVRGLLGEKRAEIHNLAAWLIVPLKTQSTPQTAQ